MAFQHKFKYALRICKMVGLFIFMSTNMQTMENNLKHAVNQNFTHILHATSFVKLMVEMLWQKRYKVIKIPLEFIL